MITNLPEFEKWLTLYITKIYHFKNHSSLNDSPINKWKEGIVGNKEQPGIGIIPRIFNEILKVVAQKRHIILIIRGSSPLSKIQTP